jgi:hypothetical protein
MRLDRFFSGVPVRKNSTRLAATSAASVLAACGSDSTVTQGAVTSSDTPLLDTVPVTQPPTLNDLPPVEISLRIENQTDATIDATGVTTLNVVFKDNASVDGATFAEAAVINLGLTADGVAEASDGRADFDQLVSTNTFLNIYDNTQNIELDFAAATESVVTINLMHEDAAIQVGREVATGSNTALEVLNGSALTLNHMTDQAAEISGGIDLNEDAEAPDDQVIESLLITTTQQGGDLSIGRTARTAAFENTGTLRDVSIAAVDGDMVLKELVNDRFMLDITELQNYHVTTNDADIEIGRMGACNLKSDMEVISLRVIDEGSILQRTIEADLSQIATVTVKSTDKNTLDASLITTAATGQYNVIFEGLAAESVRLLTVDTTDGGAVLLANQSYAVDNIVLIGTGDVTIEAGENCGIAGQGFEQGNIDTTEFEGDLTILTGGGDDTITGTNGDDTILVGTSGGSDVINDSPGEDTVIVTGGAGGDPFVLNDSCDAGSDDVYIITTTPRAGGQPYNFTFNAGAGDDYLGLSAVAASTANQFDVLIDFADWCSGTVYINQFTVDAAALTFSDFKLNFAGLDGMVSNNFLQATIANPTFSSLTSSTIYASASNATPLADFNDLSAAASALSTMVGDNTSAGDAAVFLYVNTNSGSLGITAPVNGFPNVPLVDTGTTYDYYAYYYQESDGQSGISADEISLIAAINVGTQPGLSVSEVFSATDFV